MCTTSLGVDKGGGVAHDGRMKSSAIARRLREVVAAADSARRDPALVEVWACGSFLDDEPGADADAAVVLVVDVPAGELPWLNPHPVPYFWAERLGVRRLQMAWWGRPSAWPAWNQEARRVLRVWSAAGGEESGVLDVLGAGDVASLPVVEPSGRELLEQLRVERPVAVAQFDEVVDRYWDRDFRRGLAPNPEQVLWHAARAVRDLDVAIAALS